MFICRMTPRSRIMGGRPTFRCRSDASCFMTMRKSLLTSGSLGRSPRPAARLRRLIGIGSYGGRLAMASSGRDS